MEDNNLNKKIPRLFKKALNTLNEKEDNSKITEKYISVVNNNIIENEKNLTEAQNVVLSKIMLNLISFYNNKNPSKNLEKMKEFYEVKLENNIGKDSIFDEIKNESDKSLEKFIITILKYFLKYLKENQDANDLKKKWEGLQLHLENFEINDIINSELLSYLEKEPNSEDNYYKELQDILISQLKLGKNSKIIKTIYYFINFKIKEKNQILYMKDLADKERENTEYETEINQNNTKIINDEDKPPEDYLTDVFKKWSIKIDLNEEIIDPQILYGFEEKTDKYYKEYINVNKEYNEKFKGYIEFKNKVVKHIKEEKKNIKLKTTIKLEITPIKEDKNRIYEDAKYYGFKNIQCISSYVHKGEKFEFKDKNILDNGIDGKSPGFIFLINELCNDEYIEVESK